MLDDCFINVVFLFLLWSPNSLLALAFSCKKNNVHPTSRLNTHHLILQQLGGGTSSISSSSTVWIDMENVRGKSGFELSHQQVLDGTARWVQHFQLQDRVIVVVDHGNENEAYFRNGDRFAVVFSGNHQKADDVIARSVATSLSWLSGWRK